MKKIRNRVGFSLIEMLLALGIMVLMIAGMDTGLRAATRAYNDAIFESNSATMAGIINTAIGDVLRYSENISASPEGGFTTSGGVTIPEEQAGFVFTNYEYGVKDAYFSVVQAGSGNQTDIIQLRELNGSKVKSLVNNGAYPELEVANLRISFVAPSAAAAGPGNYFNVEYDIVDMVKGDRSRAVKTTVRLLNPESSNFGNSTPSGGSTPTPTVPVTPTEPATPPEPTTSPVTPPPAEDPALAAYSEWDFEHYYLKGDVVRYGRSLYVAKKGELGEDADDDDINCSMNPSGNPDYWVESEIWDSEKEYEDDDVVVYDGIAYEAEKDVPVGVVPSESKKYWEKVADDDDGKDSDDDEVEESDDDKSEDSDETEETEGEEDND